MKHVLVTGGGGFVGSALVRRLVEYGCEVRVAGRKRYPHIERLDVQCIVGDIGDSAFVQEACRGIDTVFHTASKAGIWGSRQEYERTNVSGTENIVSACRKHGIPRLVYTSTPSVVFDCNDIENGDESLPYAEQFLCHYARTKAVAERCILHNNAGGLKTCAIRPHLIWGPDDPHLIPRLLERGKQGKLKIVGTGTNTVDITYVDNVAHSHLLAAQSLAGDGAAAGKAYFIGQERPVSLWDWINGLYRDLGIAPITRKVPFNAAYRIGALLEMVYRFSARNNEPPMTRFLALQLARSHYFSHEQAEKDFGYRPIVSLEEGKEKLLAALC